MSGEKHQGTNSSLAHRSQLFVLLSVSRHGFRPAIITNSGSSASLGTVSAAPTITELPVEAPEEEDSPEGCHERPDTSILLRAEDDAKPLRKERGAEASRAKVNEQTTFKLSACVSRAPIFYAPTPSFLFSCSQSKHGRYKKEGLH